ncbi:MAG TPA: TonB-dependent receptor [Rhizomicrobium sp.]
MKAKYKFSCAVAALLSGCGAALGATDANTQPSGIETVVVTAQRRDESIEKVPLTVLAFSGDKLADLNVSTIQDLLKYTPSVTYGNNGPGQGELFIRGLSNGFRGNQSTGTVGLYPNTAIYLDEQSMQFPARNLDIYMVDMQRIEVLEGPQGTLFGGGAEAGAVRYITNKPDTGKFSAKAEASYGMTNGGDPNSSADVTINVPLIADKLAVRLVLYDDQQGGYIDNVYSQFARKDSDPGNTVLGIHPVGGKCPDGLPAAGAWQQGGQAWCTLPNAPIANNENMARDNQNPVTHQGARASLLYQVDDDWNVLISESLQKLDAEGLSVEYPTGSNLQTLKPLQVTAFAPSWNKDDYSNTAWTVNGKLGDISLIYTGGWTLRNINQQMDYSNYQRTYYGTYYTCSGGTTSYSNFDAGGPQKCYSPIGSWHDTIKSTHMSHEVRASTPSDWQIRGIAGAYYEQFKIYDDMNFDYKTIPACTPQWLASQVGGEPVCLGAAEPYPGNPGAGIPPATANHPGPRSDATAFGEDVQRGYDQTALFLSLDYDIPFVPGLTVSAGSRWFQYQEYELGSVYTTNTSCENVLVCYDNPSFLTKAYPKRDIDAHNDHKTYAGFKSRLGVTYNVTDDIMAYYTYSEGFRPGGFNRYNTNQVLNLNPGANPQYTTPNAFGPDSLTNQEIGVKAQLFDHNLIVNLSAYSMNWRDVQFLFFQPLYTGNVTFATNGPSYLIQGAELQFIGRPMDELTIEGSATYNENTEDVSPCLIGNIVGSATFGKCITQANGGAYPNPYGVVGGQAAFSPKWQGNVRVRKDWTMGDYLGFASVGLSYTGPMWNQPANYVSGNGLSIPTTTYLRYYMPGYTTFDAAIGVDYDRWNAQIYGENLGNSHASTFTSSAQWIKSEVPLRPMVVGVKVGFTY